MNLKKRFKASKYLFLSLLGLREYCRLCEDSGDECMFCLPLSKRQVLEAIHYPTPIYWIRDTLFIPHFRDWLDNGISKEDLID